jgi:hypothetical protein
MTTAEWNALIAYVRRVLYPHGAPKPATADDMPKRPEPEDRPARTGAKPPSTP